MKTFLTALLLLTVGPAFASEGLNVHGRVVEQFRLQDSQDFKVIVIKTEKKDVVAVFSIFNSRARLLGRETQTWPLAKSDYETIRSNSKLGRRILSELEDRGLRGDYHMILTWEDKLFPDTQKSSGDLGHYGDIPE